MSESVLTFHILIADNLQVNMYGNPNVSYVAPDNNAYSYYPYMPGNFPITGENPNQIDRMYLILDIY